MNKKFTLFTLAVFSAFSIGAQQKVSDEVVLETNNDVYYNLSNSQKQTTSRTDWNIAFYNNIFNPGIRINDALGIQVYEVYDDFSKWNNVDVNNISSWKKLYNSDKDWSTGAFNRGSATYGWGNYNYATHVVNGSIIFAIEYKDGTIMKLKINDLTYGVYSITYSKWNKDNNTWSADKTVPIKTNTASSPTPIFTYYNFLNDQITTPEPSRNNWDLKFTKYITPLQAGNEVMQYSVTGVLQSDLIKVAKTETGNPTNDNDYLAEINTIGYDYKKFDGRGYIILQRNYFIKNTSTKKIYKLVFKSFEGGSLAKSTFDYEDVTSTLGTSDVEKTKFGIYTDKNQSKTIHIVYNSQTSSSNITVAVYSINGQLVHQENYRPTGSFTNKSINLSRLPTGVYIVKLESADKIDTQKIILR